MHRRPIKLVITLQGGGYLHVMNIIMDTALGVQHVTRFKKKKTERNRVRFLGNINRN